MTKSQPIRGASGTRRRLGRVQIAFLVLIAAVALVRLPYTLVSDVRGARGDSRMSARQAGEARGPAALAGTDIDLIRAARRLMPRNAAFAIERGGRWGRGPHPLHALAFVWESGESWTQFDLAPRLEVEPARASWLLLRDETPGAAGVRHVRHRWRFGQDWLVELRV